MQRILIKERIKTLYLQNLPDGVTVNKVNIFTMKLNNNLTPAPPTPKIEKREYKNVTCLICDKKFRFFPEYGYISQIMDDNDVDEEIQQLRQQNNDLEITEELRTKVQGQILFYTKLNIFPCKQLIEVLTPEQKANPEFIFNANYGEDGNGSKLMCSNCCLTSLNALDDSVQELYVGALADNIKFTPENSLSLIADLSPKELEQNYSRKYNEHRLSSTKFGQFKQNDKILTQIIDKMVKSNPIPNATDEQIKQQRSEFRQLAYQEVKIIQCRHCAREDFGRFYRTFEKKNIEILFLHCNRCGTSFNGCDFNKPYLISNSQFKRYLDSDDVCDFFNSEKLAARRQNGKALVDMEVFKNFKRAEIASKWQKKFQRINELSVKKCPNCNTITVNYYGCSAMTCSICKQTFCYVCSQAVAGIEGHDATHFLTEINAPFGSFFGIQCVNVNFTFVDPTGARGPNFGYRQNGRNIVPNPNFKLLTRITWGKYNYLIAKYRALGLDALETLLKDNTTWSKMDSVYYNSDFDKYYEQGDLNYDPDVLARNEIQSFIRRCDNNLERPILDAVNVAPGDVQAYLDEEGEPQPQPQPQVAQAQVPAPQAQVPAPQVHPVQAPQAQAQVAPQVALEEGNEWINDLDDIELAINLGLIDGVIHNGAPNNLNEENLHAIQDIIDEEADVVDAIQLVNQARLLEVDNLHAAQAANLEEEEEENLRDMLELVRELQPEGENLGDGNFFEEVIPLQNVNFEIPQNFNEIDTDEQVEIIEQQLQIELEEGIRQNQERYRRLLQLAEEYYSEDNRKLLLYQEVVRRIEEYREQNVQLPHEVNVIIRQMISDSMITYYVNTCREKNITHLCFHRTDDNLYVIILRMSYGVYVMNGQPFHYIPQENKCIEITFDNLNTFVNMYNNRLYGALYHICFEGIIESDVAIEYIYTILSRQDGGKKLFTKKNIKQKKYIKTKNNKKQLNKIKNSIKNSIKKQLKNKKNNKSRKFKK